MGNDNEIKFNIKLAGLTVGVCALHDTVMRMCRGYMTDESPDFSVSVDQKDIEAERTKSAAEDAFEGKQVIDYSDDYLETLAVYRKIAERVPDYGIFLFHGSAIAVDGVGYLFTAKSGTGKSTHARLWRETFGDRAVMVNDDKPLIRMTEEGAFVCGTPWNGKHRLGSNISVPLRAVCILCRAEENSIVPVSPADAFPMLLQQSYRPKDCGAFTKTLALVDRLGQCARLYRLGCNMKPEAAIVSYNGMQV